MFAMKAKAGAKRKKAVHAGAKKTLRQGKAKKAVVRKKRPFKKQKTDPLGDVFSYFHKTNEQWGNRFVDESE